MKQLEIGDLITSYHAGIHKVTNITEKNVNGKNYTIVRYEKVYYENLKPFNGKGKRENSCNLGFCKPAKESLRKELQLLQERIERIEEVLNEL